MRAYRCLRWLLGLSCVGCQRRRSTPQLKVCSGALLRGYAGIEAELRGEALEPSCSKYQTPWIVQ